MANNARDDLDAAKGCILIMALLLLGSFLANQKLRDEIKEKTNKKENLAAKSNMISGQVIAAKEAIVVARDNVKPYINLLINGCRKEVRLLSRSVLGVRHNCHFGFLPNDLPHKELLIEASKLDCESPYKHLIRPLPSDCPSLSTKNYHNIVNKCLKVLYFEYCNIAKVLAIEALDKYAVFDKIYKEARILLALNEEVAALQALEQTQNMEQDVNSMPIKSISMLLLGGMIFCLCCCMCGALADEANHAAREQRQRPQGPRLAEVVQNQEGRRLPQARVVRAF